MPDDAEAIPADEVEETVETVKLGGEEKTTVQEGVQQAESYEDTVAPDSPTNVEIGGSTDTEATHGA